MNKTKEQKMKPKKGLRKINRKSVNKNQAVDVNARAIHQNIETLHQNTDKVHDNLKRMEKSIKNPKRSL